jgi:hypothetical protein
MRKLSLMRRVRRRCGACSGSDRAGGGKKLLRAAHDVPGILRQDRGWFARVPRQMRRIPASLPRQRLLGEQVRVQGMWLRQAVGAARYLNAFAPSSTASSGATHLKLVS